MAVWRKRNRLEVGFASKQFPVFLCLLPFWEGGKEKDRNLFPLGERVRESERKKERNRDRQRC
jgi:hypothetical protein